jgi:hypothetical protein
MKLTISEAASHCGYASRTVLYRLLRDGRLRDYEAGRHGRNRLLESDPPGRCPLREFVAACVQLRHDSPLGQRHGPIAELSDADLGAYCDEHLGDDALAAAMAPIDRWIQGQQQEANWDGIAERLNAYLGPAWPGPPWDGEQSATVAMAMALAQEGAAEITA